MDKILQGRWQSRGGKYWVEVYTDRFGATFKSDNGGGNLGNITAIEAVGTIQQRVDAGEFQADATKSPMRRTV